MKLLATALALCLSAGLTEEVRFRRGSTLVALDRSEAVLEVIDPSTRRVLGRVPTGAGPAEVAVSGDGRRAVVSNYGEAEPGNSLTVIDLTRREVERTVDLGEHRGAHGVVFLDHRTRVLVTTEYTQSVVVVNAATGAIERTLKTDGNTSHMVAVTPNKRRAFVTNLLSDDVTVLDLESGDIVERIKVGANPEGLDASPDGREVWVANRAEDTLVILSAKTNEVLERLSTGAFPVRVRFTPDGSRVLVSNANSRDVSVFDARSREEVRRIKIELASADGAFGDVPMPFDIVVEPQGRYAFVAISTAGKVAVIDLERGAVVDAIETGRLLTGLAWCFRPEG